MSDDPTPTQLEQLTNIVAGRDQPNPDTIARFVSGHQVPDATIREHLIAGKLRKLGEKMEREGYLPAIRRQRMVAVMMREIGER